MLGRGGSWKRGVVVTESDTMIARGWMKLCRAITRRRCQVVMGAYSAQPFVPQGAMCQTQWRLWPLLSSHDAVNDPDCFLFIGIFVCFYMPATWHGWYIFAHVSYRRAKHSCYGEGCSFRAKHGHVVEVMRSRGGVKSSKAWSICYALEVSWRWFFKLF